MSAKQGGGTGGAIPFRSYLRILLAKGDSAGDTSMVVDGNVTPVLFTTKYANGTTRPWILTQLTIQIIDQGATTGQLSTTFGIAAALTNGCQLYLSDGTNRIDLAGGYRTGTTSQNLLKTNADFSSISTRQENFQIASATAQPAIRYVIEFDPPVAFPAGGFVGFLISDAISATATILNMNILAEGYYS